MQTRAMDFVAYNVADLDRSVAFYRDVLGLKLSGQWGDSFAEFEVPPTTLALVVLPPEAQRPASAGSGGAAVALSVPDVAAALEELRGKNVPVLMGPMDTPVCHMALITDPDGNSVYLHYRKDGTAG